jgi:hypothetical protein
MSSTGRYLDCRCIFAIMLYCEMPGALYFVDDGRGPYIECEMPGALYVLDDGRGPCIWIVIIAVGIYSCVVISCQGQ